MSLPRKTTGVGLGLGWGALDSTGSTTALPSDLAERYAKPLLAAALRAAMETRAGRWQPLGRSKGGKGADISLTGTVASCCAHSVSRRATMQ
jgi:hypothetical protein